MKPQHREQMQRGELEGGQQDKWLHPEWNDEQLDRRLRRRLRLQKRKQHKRG